MVPTWLPTDAPFFSPQGFSMQGQYSGVSPAEVSLSLWQWGLCPPGWLLVGMPVLGGTGALLISAITPNTTFLLFALSGQVTKLQQLSGHALPFAPLGHAPTMVPGEHLLCSPKAGCGPPDPH